MEVDILADGSLDMDDETLAELDVVVVPDFERWRERPSRMRTA